jgi:hypothetical protein
MPHQLKLSMPGAQHRLRITEPRSAHHDPLAPPGVADRTGDIEGAVVPVRGDGDPE